MRVARARVKPRDRGNLVSGSDQLAAIYRALLAARARRDAALVMRSEMEALFARCARRRARARRGRRRLVGLARCSLDLARA